MANSFEFRNQLFKNVMGSDKRLNDKLKELYKEKGGNWQAISKELTVENGFKPEMVKKLEFTHFLSSWSNGNAKLVNAFHKDEKTNSMRDIALNFNKAELTKRIRAEKAYPEDQSAEKYASALHTELFHMEPTAVVQRMMASAEESPVTNKMLSGNIATFLGNQPETFNIKTTSVYDAFKTKNAFKGIASDLQEGVKKELKSLQRAIAISPVPEALPVLMKTNMTSALQVSDMPAENFITSFSAEYGDNGESVAKQVHNLAVNVRIRNEQTLMAIKEIGQGTGVAFIDKTLYSGADIPGGMQPMMHGPMKTAEEYLAKHNLSWDLLFNDADFCECGECNSVYSAAAYFVDLLQYLRNNNIDKTKIKADPKDISNTPLEKLFIRRPDLGCLQLTCKNTNTILPYIDLVNEIMENYVVFHFPKPFNVEDETSGELLAQPQHTEYDAYCILQKTVYPFTLPYHQPIDAARIYMDYLATARHELIDTFRSQRKAVSDTGTDNEDLTGEVSPLLNETEKEALDSLHTAFINRAVDAEYLGLTREEYVILTKETFVSKEYWDKLCKKDHTTEEYRIKIGLKPVYEYYGYSDEKIMLSRDEGKKDGLTFVKDQFLRRTGILYLELVELLKTRCLNPNMPQGLALSIMESIRFSYRFLQTLVDSGASSPRAKYDKLVKMLTSTQPFIPMVEALLHPDPCSPGTADPCVETKDLEKWVHCYFERIGKMIVLENGTPDCMCPEGQFFWTADGHTSEVHHFFYDENGMMMDDGKYFLDSGCNVWAEGRVPALDRNVREIVGSIDKSSGRLILSKGNFGTSGQNEIITIKTNDGEVFRLTGDRFLNAKTRHPLGCKVAQQTDTCDLNNVRLAHLDGSNITVEEYDHIHRFIRLWRKSGWTIDETDKALTGLGSLKSTGEDLLMEPEDCTDGCDELFDDSGDCRDANAESDDDCFDCESSKPVSCDITPQFLHQMVSVKKLADKTNLELIKLLTFWTNISTNGEKSLYRRLFLTHNMLGIDKGFREDKNGHYLVQPEKITAHIPALMAAFNLSADDISTIMEFVHMEDSLTLANLSRIYRYRLLSRTVGLRIPDFIHVLPVFGNPFKSAAATLEFLHRWGKMEDAGFTHQQLNYMIRDVDHPKKPLAPTQKSILQLAKNLYDGLNAIELEHKDVHDGETIPAEMVKAKAILLYDQTLTEQITALTEGTQVFVTNAPKNLDITPDENKSLSKKLKYDRKQGIVQVTGRLTVAETTDFKSLSNDMKWIESLVRIEKQQDKLYKQLLHDVAENGKLKSPERKVQVEKAEKVLKEGDITIPPDQIPEGQEDPNTAAKKRLAFLIIFMPYLRQQLTHRFITDTLSALTGLDQEVTDVLISEVLTTGTPAVTLYSVFESVKAVAAPVETNWKGYLIPASDGQYTFVAKDSDSMPNVSINGQSLSFSAQEDPTNEWWSTSLKLQAGKLYLFETQGLELKNLHWKTATSTISGIPTSALLPGFASESTTSAFTRLKKAAILVSGFDLSRDELQYLNIHKSDFGGLDFNRITLTHWMRLEAYTRLRNSLPASKSNILEFFGWCSQTPDPSTLHEKIADLTGRKKEWIAKLTAEEHFRLLKPEDFVNEINLLKLQHALSVAEKTGMDIDLLFDWAKPTSNFKKCREVAESIQKAIRAKYNQEDWEQVVKPLNDKLRENQKNALIAYLLQQPDLLNWGVTDADGLFEYFLIDVQMAACMETSRIKQALSSVQLFVQRCFLGLEEKVNGITPDILSRERWNWMQRYRVWEANRKVFLYPENWIETNLRDDKSPFFKELESELLQKDINRENVKDALKSYLYKVDEVANMEVIGLHIEMDVDQNGSLTDKPVKLHVFSRTRGVPYIYYYRYFTMDSGNWSPWEKVPIDIPNNDLEDLNGLVIGNGSYLIPIVWNRRLFVLFPQFMKKTEPIPSGETKTSKDSGGNIKVPYSRPSEFWEIKLGWTEYRQGKWTQKQLSKDAIKHNVISPYKRTVEVVDKHSTIDYFDFFPQLLNDKVQIIIYANLLGTAHIDEGFSFDGTHAVTIKTQKLALITPEESYDGPFQYFEIQARDFSGNFQYNLHSLQTVASSPSFSQTEPFFKLTNIDSSLVHHGKTIPFHYPYISDLIKKLNLGDLDDFFGFNRSITDKTNAFGAYDHDKDSLTPEIYHELKRPYSIYSWEMFFHTPVMLAEALSKANHFEEAMKWYHFVFNPMAMGNNDKRFWMFSPFREIRAEKILESIFNSLKPNTPDDAIGEWRNHPFMPHLVARSRPVAYMKWVVMKYIDNLVEWGDHLFRQDTIESINQATQLYILALHILGPRPQMIPRRGKIRPQTYNSLLDKWDAFSNAMVELELVAPYSNQIDQPIGSSNGVTGLANIFGFSTSLYFCIPNNPKLMGYWDTLADRLFKIRHCENIQGVFRKLPLFEPPIDPALLVKAAAQGLSIDSVLNDLYSPMPNYRFYYLMQKALELCIELKSLGNGMLAAIEKKDNEALSLLRAKHETSMQNLVMEIKKHQLEESQKALDGLFQNRKLPEHRMKYYLRLIGADTGSVPQSENDFSEIMNSIEQPVDEGGLKLIKYEKEEMDKAAEASDKQEDVGRTEVLGSILNIIPNFSGNVQPFGIGLTMSFGGSNLGAATQAVARANQVVVANRSFSSTNAQRKAGYLRQLQERIMQANSAGYEIKQIDKQILAQEIRLNIANQDITNQQKLIDNANEIEEFLKNKYTNEELHVWMKGSLKTMYRQVYNLANDLAKKAEKVFCFERGLTNSSFIQPGYWDAGRDGLLAGEQLYIGLKQLEAAYLEQRGYDYEITKHISLRQINPLAVIQLKETGKCEFALPELLFDMDYPGHYKRRIKTVSLSIPCVAGPYNGLNATLRLTENKFRNTAMAKDKNDYPEKTDADDERFLRFNIPITAIAASSGQNDSGMFEMIFRDERFLPFEGAGVISKWSLELPGFRQVDYNTISDAILTLKFTSCEGGERLKKAASQTVLDFAKSNEELGQREGLFAVIDLKHDLPNEWHKAMQVREGDTVRTLALNKLSGFLPYFAMIDKDGKPRNPDKIKVTDTLLLVDTELRASDFALNAGDGEISFGEGVGYGSVNSYAIHEEIETSDWKLLIKNTDKKIDKAFLVVRFILS